MNAAPHDTDRAKSILAELLAAKNFHELVTRTAAELQHAPDDPELLGFAVTGLMHFGRTTDVIEKFQKTLAIDPNNDFALLGIGLVLEKYSAEEARHAFRKFFSLEKERFFEGAGNCGIRMSRVSTFDRWCEVHGSVVYYPAQDVTVVNPAIGVEQQYHCDAVRGITVPSASIVAGWDFVISPDGEVLDGSGFQDLSVTFKLVRHVYSPEKQRVVYPSPAHCIDVDEDALFLSGTPGSQFGNWICDFLPRLIGWRRPGARPLKIAVARALDRHQCDTLSVLGVRGSDIIWCEIGQNYRFRSLHVVQPGDMYRPHPQVTLFLHRGLGPDPATRPARRTLGRRFFLERSRSARGRNVVNQAELNRLLEEAGFEIIRRPEIPVLQQNAMFQAADIILSVFGTDLVTAYQLRPGADLIALYFDHMMGPEVAAMNAFAGMCATIGVRLHYLLCSRTQKDDLKSGYWQDIVVDCDALRSCLDEIISRRSLEYAADWAPSEGEP